MIHRYPYNFTEEQKGRFKQRNGYAPTTQDIRLLKLEGPVIYVGVWYKGAQLVDGTPSSVVPPDKPTAVAMVDTGCDRTTVALDSLQAWLNACGRASLGRSFHTKGASGFEDDDLELTVSDPRSPPSTAVPLPKVRVWVSRTELPGYEHILIGRDILDQVAFCFSAQQFSIIAPPAPRALGPHDPCCRP